MGHDTNSNFETRFDLQGWGENIVTTGSGDKYGEEDPNYFFTERFGATSGASAVVAGAVAVLVGYWKENISSVLPRPADFCALLKSTGTPQDLTVPGHIGPRPNLRAAIEEAHGVATNVAGPSGKIRSGPPLLIVPSPMNAGASLLFETREKGYVTLEVFNAAGWFVRLVFAGEVRGGLHSFEWRGEDEEEHPVSSGVYFCRLLIKNRSSVQRVVVVR